MTSTYEKGAQVRDSVAFTDINGGAVDPTGVTVSVRDPSGNVATYVYDDDAEIVKDSTGNYHVDIDMDETGTWRTRWVGSGSAVAAVEGKFIVRDSSFD